MIFLNKRLLLAICLSLCVGAAVHSRSFAGDLPESAQSGSSADIDLSLTVSKRRYSLSENLILDATLRNVRSFKSFFVYDHLGWGSGSGMSLVIEDTFGRQIRTLSMDDVPLPPPASGDPALLVGIGVGQFFGLHLAQPIHDFIDKPGRYRLRAIYSSVLDPELLPPNLRNLNVIYRGYPPIASSWITIDVGP